MLPDTKRNVWYAVVRVDLLKMVDNGRMVCPSVNVLIGGNLFLLDLYVLRYLATRRLRTARYELTRAEHQLAQNAAIL